MTQSKRNKATLKRSLYSKFSFFFFGLVTQNVQASLLFFKMLFFSNKGHTPKLLKVLLFKKHSPNLGDFL